MRAGYACIYVYSRMLVKRQLLDLAKDEQHIHKSAYLDTYEAACSLRGSCSGLPDLAEDEQRIHYRRQPRHLQTLCVVSIRQHTLPADALCRA